MIYNPDHIVMIQYGGPYSNITHMLQINKVVSD